MLNFLVIGAASWWTASLTPLLPFFASQRLQFWSIFVSAYVTGILLYSLGLHLYYARKAKKLGCKPPPFRQGRLPFGIDLIQRLTAAGKRNQVPEEMPKIFAETGKNTFTQRTLGKDIIMTIDPKNVQAILATQFPDFGLGSLREKTFFPMLGHGIFTVDGKYWEHSRALLRPQFTRDQVADLELEETHVQDMFKHLPVNSDRWTDEVNLGPLFFRLTLDSATEFLFGHSVHSQVAALPDTSVEKQDFVKAGHIEWGAMASSFDGALAHIGRRSRLQRLYWLHNPQEFKDNCREVHRFADFYVNQALKEADDTEKSAARGGDSDKPRRYIFLNELVKSTRDPHEIRYQLLNILLAGRDTTAGLLGWTFWLLARDPTTYSKLRQTILNDFGTFADPHNITFATLKSCTYLQHVLNEVLRLFPAVPGNARRAFRDTTIPRGGGPDGLSPVFVKKGTDVVYNVLTMHRRVDLWGPDADEFRPERWVGRRPGWEYLPFNGGPRICLGQQFALTEAGYVIVRMCQRYEALQNCDVDDVRRHQFGVTSAPFKVGVKLREDVSLSS